MPGVDLVRNPPGASDLVLLAHGGEEESLGNPHSWRPALLRMWPFAVAARSAAPGAAVGFMRYRYRGWNATAADRFDPPHPAARAVADPVVDLRAVLDQLPSVVRRVLLIGHSMGGRAVVAAGDHARVAGVLALAPWLPVGEPLVGLRAPVMFAHGADDTITDPAATMAYAARVRAAGTPVRTYLLAGEDHAMLHRSGDWNRLVADFIRSAQDSQELSGSQELPETNRGLQAATVGEIALARFRLPVRERFRVG
ncbi:alpha/beta fold hydrolase [Kribbella solani]|uniref:Pimeloyl-ACP methyl ester carboxylesterase n=1 Tax=Kribbella solani TaxID=236067 RepID=A0A841E240_9ACTN|nr:pimeloyl-ACP methyl ester carboxylesterase [Kribbella solani]